MPLTASKTDAETNATTRPVTFGAVPAASTVLFITPIHWSTGSGVAAAAGRGLTAMPLSSKAHIVAIPKNFLMRSLLWGDRESRIVEARRQWTEAGLLPDYCRRDNSMKQNGLRLPTGGETELRRRALSYIVVLNHRPHTWLPMPNPRVGSVSMNLRLTCVPANYGSAATASGFKTSRFTCFACSSRGAGKLSLGTS